MSADEIEPKYDVFISYSREDDKEKPFVDRLGKDLADVGKKKVWWDKTHMESRGRPFQNEINDAIRNSERLIAVIGPNALRSEYVWKEWIYAYHFQTAIVPVLRRGTYEAIPEVSAKVLWRDKFERLPDRFDASKLKTLHCPDFTDDASYQKSLEELLRVLDSPLLPLAKILGDPPAFPPPNFVMRDNVLKKLAKLRYLDSKDLKSFWREKRIMVIHGPGGSGKSVVANGIAHATQTRWTFTDGIIWLEIGQPPRQEDTGSDKIHIFTALIELGKALKQNLKNYRDVQSAKQFLKELLTKRPYKQHLFILDDVWDSGDAQHFVEILGRGCSMVITARNTAIVSELSVPDDQTVSLRDLLLSEKEARQLLADWANLPVEMLPSTSDEVIDICGRYPLPLAICGAIVREGFPLEELPVALLDAKEEEVTETKIPGYKKEEVINVFAPMQVALDYLRKRDEQDRKVGKKSQIQRFDQYVDLAVLRGGVKTPGDAISALWIARRKTTEFKAWKLLANLNALALLRLLSPGDDPGPSKPQHLFVQLRKLQTAYLQTKLDELEEGRGDTLHEDFGRALFDTWRTGMLAERQLDETERKQEEEYCRRFLLQHLVEGKCWKELKELLGHSKYLGSRQDPEGQMMLEAEMADLLRSEEPPVSPNYLENRQDAEGQKTLVAEIAELLTSERPPVSELLAGAREGITKNFPLGREKADWLDIFAYWLNKYGRETGQWKSEQIKNIARQFDRDCGEVSERLAEKYMREGNPDWAMRFAELRAWVCQRRGDYAALVDACDAGIAMCRTEQIAEGYRTLGLAEFMRMRAYAYTHLAEEANDDGGQALTRAAQGFEELSELFSQIGSKGWWLTQEEWLALAESGAEGFALSHRQPMDDSRTFTANVVSNEHDAIGAMYLIQALESRGEFVNWIHHEQFKPEQFDQKDIRITVLIGGPKAPGISAVAHRFYESGSKSIRKDYLRMYSGLHFGPIRVELLNEKNSSMAYMLGGVSKLHTLQAVYEFTTGSHPVLI